MNKKRVEGIAVAAAVVALVAVGSTLAYLTSTPAERVNRFSIGTLTPDIHENSSSTPDSSQIYTVSGTDSNYSVDKVVAVTNVKSDTAIPGYFRVQLVPTLTGTMTDSAGSPTKANIGGNFAMPTSQSPIINNVYSFTPFGDSNKLQIQLVFADGWSSRWFYVPEENCFYYKSVLKPGDTTEPLLKSIHYTGTDAKNYVSGFYLDVLTDAVQAEGGAIHSGSGTPANPWPRVKVGADGELELN